MPDDKPRNRSNLACNRTHGWSRLRDGYDSSAAIKWKYHVWTLHPCYSGSRVESDLRLSRAAESVAPLQHSTHSGHRGGAASAGGETARVGADALGTGALLGRRSVHWQPDDQCAGGVGRGKAGLPQRLCPAALSGPGGWLL